MKTGWSRGKCIGDDAIYGWVEGYYVCLKDPYKNRESHRIYTGFAESDCGEFYGDWYEVDPKTVGLFTGLYDKNDERIFKDDVLEYRSYTGTGIEEISRAVVFWDEHRWSYKTIYNNRWTDKWNNKGYKCDVYKDVVANYGEVIGNIHDNPELFG